MATLSTKTAPHLPWSLAPSAPAEVAAPVTAAAAADVLGVTPEVPSGEPVRGKAKGGRGGGSGGGGGGGGGDEAMADAAKAPPPAAGATMHNAEAEAAAAEAAVDAVGDDGALGHNGALQHAGDSIGPKRFTASAALTNPATSPSSKAEGPAPPPGSAAACEATLRRFYAAYNSGDADAAAACMAESCSYHDTVFPEPFIGRAAVRGHFVRTFEALGPAVKFCVDAVAASPDGASAGVKWHCELDDGTPLPNSRGCSFYEFEDGTGLVAAARDCVEPAIKPGGAALALLRAVLPAIRAAGRANSSSSSSSSSPLSSLTPASAALWAGFVIYFCSIFGSASLPGVPVWQTPPSVLAAVWHESLNFFYVNNILHALGFTLIPDTPEHPTSEAIFNFDAAWGLLFGPAWLADWRRREVAGISDRATWGWWMGTMLLTNVFAWPYMAAREQRGPATAAGVPQSPPPTALASGLDPAALAGWAPAVGVVGGVVGLVSLAWAAFGRPEAGDLAARAAWFADAAGSSDRAIFAFTLDACCYAVWQSILLRGAAPGYRFVPFFGLAAWLAKGGGGTEK